MSWFGKKEDKTSDHNLELPRLPELPKLRDMEDYDDDDKDHFSQNPLPRLPSYPNTHFGKNFSKKVIKDAVVGKKESDMGSEDFADDSFEHRMMQRPSRVMTREIPHDYDEEIESQGKIYPVIKNQRSKETEPIYIRLDKFNESAKVFESTMEKVDDIQRTLNEIKKIRHDEEADLAEWEREIQEIKRQLDKIDREVFSGV